MKIKHITKRVLAFSTAFLLGCSLLAAPVLPADAAAQSGSAVEYSTTGSLRNVMYYGDWSIWGGQGNFYPKGIPADQLTHLNFAFLDFDKDGNLVFTDKDAATGAPVGMDGVQWGAANAGILSAMQELRAKNPNLRMGVSLGGWSKSGDFSTVSANALTRKVFVENVMKFIKYTNMDFVDLDWEYPGEKRDGDLVDNKNDEGTPNASDADKDNYILLLQDLRDALDKQGKELNKTYELTVALPAPKAKLDKGIDIKKLFQIVDFANIMTYDMRGAWDETSGHQTGLYTNPNDPLKDAGLSVDAAVSYLLANGAPSDKIVIGAAFYTRGWEKVSAGPDANLPGLFGEAEVCAKDADQTASRGANNEAPLKDGEGGRRGGVWSYRSLSKLKSSYPGLKEYWDDTAKAPYMYDASTGVFFTYDNQRSIKEKAAYVKANKLGGMISWMASQDAETTVSGQRDELTKTIKESLFGSAPLQQYKIGTTDADVDVSVETFDEEWTRSQGYKITIKNNAVKNESGEVLSLVEEACETIKSPKIYIKTKSGSQFSPSGYGCGTVTNEDGYCVIDLSTVYDNQTIGQGATCSFQIKSSDVVDLNDIISIEMTQRITKSGPEISRQLVYGKVTDEPFIIGVADKEIQEGESFNALEGVKATDVNDGDITSSIKVTGSVDTSKAGTYNLTYTVTNKKGKTATVSCVITVKEKSETPDVGGNTYDPSKVYYGGETVVYNGQTYRCKWWTQGDVPGNVNGPWALV